MEGANSALGPAAPDPPHGHRRLNPSRPAPRFPSKFVQKVVRKISASAFSSRLRREKEMDGGYWPPGRTGPGGRPAGWQTMMDGALPACACAGGALA